MVKGVHHVGLTVSHLKESANFFVEYLNWKIIRVDNTYPAIFVSNGTTTITLWEIQSKPEVKFDRKKNIGLHHLALSVESKNTLYSIYEKLKEKFRIEFKPELLREGPNEHFICYEPSGIRIEFIFIA